MAANATNRQLELDRNLERLHLLDAEPVVGNVSRLVTGTPPKGRTPPPK
uniref:Uncharacterized protein n=1 Tax=Plectus sambesii TaxID=2011161 RepID=A0A914W5B4_9BILA